MIDIIAVQPKCPFCRSDKVVGDSRKNASSYLRCAACGEIWHPDRAPRTRPEIPRPR